MFKVLVLVCSIEIAPQECQVGNAVDILWAPDAANEMMCGFTGQAYIAQTALATGIGHDHYLKVACIRSSPNETAGTDSGTADISELDGR